MLTYTYIEKGKFALVEKPKPTIIAPTDAIVRVTMSSICKEGEKNGEACTQTSPLIFISAIINTSTIVLL